MNAEADASVLLVDDQPSNLLALEAVLEGMNLNLVRAVSGSEALGRALEQDFAVVLLDIQMPGMDGLETARQLKERDRSRATPIIFLTAYGPDQQDLFRGYSVGAVDYLFKPINPEVLRSKVAAFVQLFQSAEQLKRQARLLEERGAELARANADLVQEVAQRRRAEEALRLAHDELERRVLERTHELARANRALQAEVRERQRTEERIKASLQEKEVLLREIHHRVKNNLSVISGLLSLQAHHVRDEQALGMFRESQQRVKTMALIHDHLYRSHDLARIDFAEYLRRLTAHMLRAYRAKADAVVLDLRAEGVVLGIDTVIPCALLTHELVSNCLKHAFPGGTGRVEVEVRPRPDGQFTLMVRDDGVGLPHGMDFRNTPSLGLQLVNTLARQLDGSIEVSNGVGTTFQVTFSELKYRERR